MIQLLKTMEGEGFRSILIMEKLNGQLCTPFDKF